MNRQLGCALLWSVISSASCRRPNAPGGNTPPLIKATATLDVGRMAADSALVLVRGDRLDAVFPTAELNADGCTLAAAGQPRGYSWTVSYRNPPLPTAAELSGPRRREALIAQRGEHLIVSTGIAVDLSNVSPVTEARLDSAFARRAVGVWITRVFPAMTDGYAPPELVEPELRAIYFDHHHLHYVIKGAAALHTFLRFNPERVDLKWCTREHSDSVVSVPLVRVPNP